MNARHMNRDAQSKISFLNLSYTLGGNYNG